MRSQILHWRTNGYRLAANIHIIWKPSWREFRDLHLCLSNYATAMTYYIIEIIRCEILYRSQQMWLTFVESGCAISILGAWLLFPEHATGSLHCSKWRFSFTHQDSVNYPSDPWTIRWHSMTYHICLRPSLLSLSPPLTLQRSPYYIHALYATLRWLCAHRMSERYLISHTACF